MFKWVGKIFGTDKAINTAADGLYNGVDMAFYTEEEKAIAREKRQALYIKLLAAYEPFKLAQRVLAILYSVPYVSLVITGIILEIITSNNNTIVEQVNDALGFQTMLILGFYFGGGAFEGVVRAKATIKEKQ